MALKIKKASDPIVIHSIKELVYGEPGIGKTTLALTAPEPILLDFDLGIRRVDPKFRKDYIEVKEWADISELFTDTNSLKDYKTIVVDTVGKMLEVLSRKIIAENYKLGSKTGGLTLQGYGALAAEFRAFNASLQALGKNIIYIAHDVESKDGEKVKLRPDITGKSMGTVLREMDLVGYMQSRNNQRTISYSPTDTYYGKNTCGLNEILNIDDLNKTTDKPMAAIFDKFKAMVDSQSEVLQKYTALMDVIDTKIEAVKDVVSATDIKEELAALEEVWDSKAMARIKFNDRLAELKIKWNKEKKLFEKEVSDGAAKN